MKFILYLFPILATLGFAGYVCAFGPLWGYEALSVLEVFFIFGLPFYLMSILLTCPYSFIAVYLIYKSLAKKVDNDPMWVHFRVSGIWQLVLSFSYFGVIASGYPITV